ncbi:MULTISPECIES: superoxide dismutase family protein [unclassified Massilia]|uniref:superoxide dismutase family protein n=1 Tax=unclassified Massilia TaxID=2609279 RepID=UPI0009EC41C9|nr:MULTISPECIES: superoxide dismutase family protein [unclassified Massilia]
MNTHTKTALLACTLAAALAGTASAQTTPTGPSAKAAQTPVPAAAGAGGQLQAPMTLVSAGGTGKMIGVVSISESPNGLVFTPKLTDLPAGPHGYHVHENGSCGVNEKDGQKVAAGAAGGHFDPHGTKQHLGPAGNGHLGDLPPLVVGADGRASVPVTAPHLKTLAEVKGKALMIHAGGDNYADKPAPLGGGGARIACGVIQ